MDSRLTLRQLIWMSAQRIMEIVIISVITSSVVIIAHVRWDISWVTIKKPALVSWKISYAFYKYVLNIICYFKKTEFTLSQGKLVRSYRYSILRKEFWSLPKCSSGVNIMICLIISVLVKCSGKLLESETFFETSTQNFKNFSSWKTYNCNNLIFELIFDFFDFQWNVQVLNWRRMKVISNHRNIQKIIHLKRNVTGQYMLKKDISSIYSSSM